jgi:predicted small lipoprotein YifL
MAVLSVCAGLALAGCGQRGALYMPGSTPPQSKHAHFIFGGDTPSKSNSAGVAAKPKAAPAVNPPNVARPFVAGPISGPVYDDPLATPAATSSITVNPDVTPTAGSAS